MKAMGALLMLLAAIVTMPRIWRWIRTGSPKREELDTSELSTVSEEGE